MRLKEIEARLAEIKEELNTRAAELTDEEITKLETEVTDLQEERTALLAAAEKRKKLLERIAAGEPTGGAGADTTLLRNFKGAGGAGAGEPEDKYDTTAYRKAFMNYVCRGVAIPAEYRAAETTTTADSGAVIPTTIMNEIIQKLESYGSIYAKVRKINVQGGVSIPIADLKPTAHWITEAKSSDDQKASAKNSVTFNYYGLECKISQSILANVVTLKMFTDLFVPMATEAMVKAIEIAIFNGTGEGQPLGVLKDSRVTAVITLTPEEYASWNGWHKVKGKMKKAYRNGSFVMNQSTFDTGIDGMEDKNGQPIGRTNYGVNGEETYRFMGKNVETVEDDVLPSWDDANEGDVIAVFMNFSDFIPQVPDDEIIPLPIAFSYSDTQFEHIKKYIITYQNTLDNEHDVAVMLTNFGSSITMEVTHIGYEKSVLMVFQGYVNGRFSVLIQHVSQLNFLLTSVPKDPEKPKRKIGFATSDVPD